MRTAIKVAALVAAVCAVAAIALAGGALASGGHAAEGLGMMNNHDGTGALNGHGMGHKNGACASNNCQEHQDTCVMNAGGAAACGSVHQSSGHCNADRSGQSCAASTEMNQDHVRGCH